MLNETTATPAAITADGRLARWHNDSLAPNRTADTLAGRAMLAVETARQASDAARLWSERNRRATRRRVSVLGATGTTALVGLLGIGLDPLVEHRLALWMSLACAVVAAATGLMLFRIAWRGDRDDAATAVASDLALCAQGRHLAQLATLVEAQPDTTVATVLTRLIAETGRTADAARDREDDRRAGTGPAGRRHARIVPRKTHVMVRTADGRSLHAQTVDLSQSGVALDGNFPGCEVGHDLQIGSRAAQIVRVLPRGLACEFTDLIPDAEFSPDIIL